MRGHAGQEPVIMTSMFKRNIKYAFLSFESCLPVPDFIDFRVSIQCRILLCRPQRMEFGEATISNVEHECLFWFLNNLANFNLQL